MVVEVGGGDQQRAVAVEPQPPGREVQRGEAPGDCERCRVPQDDIVRDLVTVLVPGDPLDGQDAPVAGHGHGVVSHRQFSGGGVGDRASAQVRPH
jgi:hypothetical protein